MALLDIDDARRSVEIDVSELNRRFDQSAPEAVLDYAIGRLFPGEIAAVSSFGAESAVLLHMIARVDVGLPVYFIDTGKHFGETLRYRERLISKLRLTDIRIIKPDKAELANADPDGLLFSRDADRCCALRKTAPLIGVLRPYGAWITGRKRYHSTTRARLELFEEADGRIKLNPLAHWGTAEIADYARHHDLPRHPLIAQGYRSIGCMPCTTRTAQGENPRAGRWRDNDKTECGIHLPGYEQDGSGI